MGTALARLIVLIAALAASPAVAHAQAVEYRLGAQDRITVTVFGEPDLSGEFQLDGSGNIAVPLVGEVALAGRTLREAESAIVGKLQPDFLRNPRVNVQVTNYRPFYILGEVREPGGYAYIEGMTVVQAIALAGGFTYRARESRMHIIRGGDRSGGKVPATQNTPVLPGDIVEVPERYF